MRDVLLGDVPPPALLGAVVVVAADGLGLSGQPWAVVAAALVPTLRMLGVWRDGHAPVAPLPLLVRSLGLVLTTYAAFAFAGLPFAFASALLAPVAGLLTGGPDWLVLLPRWFQFVPAL